VSLFGALREIIRAEAQAVPPFVGQSTQFTNRLDEESLNYHRAYELVAPVYGAISRIQGSIAEFPLVFRNAGGTIIEPAPNNVAGLFASANAFHTGYDLREQIVGSMLIGGNAYVFLDYHGTKKPLELFCIPPHMVVPKSEDGRVPTHYIVTLDDGKEMLVEAQQMIPIPMYTPTHGLIGMSPMRVAMLAASTYRDSGRWLSKVYKSGGLVNGYMTHEEAMMPAERERVEHDMVRQRMKGSMVIMPRKMDWKRTGLTVDELRFVETAKLTKDDIFMIYKVPPVVMGTKEGGGLSDAGATTDMWMYYELCLKPITQKIVTAIQERFLNDRTHQSEFGVGITVEFDFSNSAVLQDLFARRAERLKNASGRPVITPNEARESLGLDPTGNADDDTLYIPKSQSVAEDDEERGRSTGTATRTPRAMARTDTEVRSQPEAPASRDALRARQDARLIGQERTMRRGVRQLFAQQERRVIAKLRDQQARLNGNRRFAAVIDIEQLLEATDADKRLIRRFIRQVVRNAGERELQELGLRISFNIGAEAVRRWLDDRANIAIVGTTRTTRELLRESLAEGVKNGETHAELVARVREVFRERYANQGDTIVRTETVSAYNFGAEEAWHQSGEVEAKEWVTAGDELVREAHAEADGQVVPLDDLFEVDGESLSHPGDHTHGASAGNTINCRCTAAPVLSKEAARRRLSISPIAELVSS
jgi:HK97 family phage portal protein